MIAAAPQDGLRFGRFSRRELTVVTIAAIVFVCFGFIVVAPRAAPVEMIDHTLFTETVDRMRSGAGYYEAMDGALAELYGPERAAVTETVIGFRMPTTFLVWRLLPNDYAIWLLYVFLAGGAGLVTLRIAHFPPTAMLVVIYLLSIAMLRTNGVWTSQFTATELWAVPVMLCAVVAVTKERWWLAAALGLLAFAVRETAAPLLLIGAGLALFGRLPRRPWLTALGGAIGLYALHAILATPFIDPSVATPLQSRADVPLSFLRILEFGLPAGYIVGPGLWIAALWRVHSFDRHRLLLSAYLWLPLIGLLVERRYWGVMVVPFMLVWGIDQVVESIASASTRGVSAGTQADRNPQ